MLTDEQKIIINSEGNIVINAYAGTGKTTTLVEYVKHRPNINFLYIAFNRSVKNEAINKFKECSNVVIETAHSLAYRKYGNKFKEISNLKVYDITKKFNIDFISAKNVIDLFNYYCNSDIIDICTIESSSVNIVRKLLKAMINDEIAITHDFYLKLYHLSKPVLDFDTILFDEGQDASPVMLDIFLNQKANKIIIGDTNQQIYGFRYAIDSLSKVDFNKYYLTNSFRFPQAIANIANNVLGLKRYLGDNVQVNIIGNGVNVLKTKAIIARTNISLLDKIIEYKGTINLEGDINSYIFTDNGTSIYDVLNLMLKKRNKVNNKFILEQGNFNDLKDYAKEANDNDLKLTCQIVEKYKNNLFKLIPEIKKRNVSKNKASIIFSTVHKAKGMEYGQVTLTDSFINESKLSNDEELAKIKNPNEEINLLYVALTRTTGKLMLPIIFND